MVYNPSGILYVMRKLFPWEVGGYLIILGAPHEDVSIERICTLEIDFHTQLLNWRVVNYNLFVHQIYNIWYELIK